MPQFVLNMSYIASDYLGIDAKDTVVNALAKKVLCPEYDCFTVRSSSNFDLLQISVFTTQMSVVNTYNNQF